MMTNEDKQTKLAFLIELNEETVLNADEEAKNKCCQNENKGTDDDIIYNKHIPVIH